MCLHGNQFSGHYRQVGCYREVAAKTGLTVPPLPHSSERLKAVGPHACLHDENLSFGQLIPYFRKSDIFPWPVNQLHVALVRGPLPPPPPPQADTHQLFMDHDWQDRAITEQFIMLLRNTTSLVLITLGFMTFGFSHERDSGIARGVGGFWRFSQTRELNRN